MRIVFILAILLICNPTAFSATGAKFLALETGARPIGMGGAFTAYTSDPYSAAYNPAAAFGIKTFTGSFSHDTYWKNRRYESGYVAFMKGPIVFNIGLQFSEISDIEARQTATDVPDYLFNSPDLALKFAGAFKINNSITAGMALGWIFEKIDTYRDNAYTLDLGLIILPHSNLTLGLSAMNIGSKMKINTEEYDIPTGLRVGALYSFKNLKPAIDFVYLDKDLRVHLGGEYFIKNALYLRAGYRFGYDTKNISAGAGFVRKNIRIDYAFTPYKNNLGDSHIFSLTFSL